MFIKHLFFNNEAITPQEWIVFLHHMEKWMWLKCHCKFKAFVVVLETLMLPLLRFQTNDLKMTRCSLEMFPNEAEGKPNSSFSFHCFFYFYWHDLSGYLLLLTLKLTRSVSFFCNEDKQGSLCLWDVFHLFCFRDLSYINPLID